MGRGEPVPVQLEVTDLVVTHKDARPIISALTCQYLIRQTRHVNIEILKREATMKRTSGTGRRQSRRSTLRLLHIVVGSLLATYVYLPAGEAPWLQWTLMLAGVPAVAITGVWMWKQAAIRRLLNRFSGQPTRSVGAAPTGQPA